MQDYNIVNLWIQQYWVIIKDRFFLDNSNAANSFYLVPNLNFLSKFWVSFLWQILIATKIVMLLYQLNNISQTFID